MLLLWLLSLMNSTMTDHIRLLQAYAICHKLDEVRRENEHLDPVCLCGDFNSGPLSGKWYVLA